MAKPTIRSLQNEIVVLRTLRNNDSECMKRQTKELDELRGKATSMQGGMSRLNDEIRWFKRLIEALIIPSQERTKF